MSLVATVYSSAEVTFFTEESQWLERVVNIETLATDTVNIGQADEIDMAPAVNTSLPGTLTFRASATGLSRDFELNALQPGADLVFSDTNVSSAILPTYADALSIGRVDAFENDDWSVVLTSGPSATAFAFDLRDNQVNIGGVDRLRVFAADGSVLGETTSIPASAVTGGSFFIGIVSEHPIATVEFDEDENPDDIAIANLRFGLSIGVIRFFATTTATASYRRLISMWCC